MTAKSERIEVRADTGTKEHIQRAAEAARTNFSGFVLDAVTREADRVLAREQHVLMPADQFDALMASLDTADPAPKLAETAQRPRRFVRQ